MGPVPPPALLPIVLRIPGGLNPERTIFIEGEIKIDASWFSISLQCSSSLHSRDDIPFHLEISFNERNTTYKATSYMSGQWDDEASMFNSRRLQEKLEALKIATDSLGVKVSTVKVDSELTTIKESKSNEENSQKPGPSNDSRVSSKSDNKDSEPKPSDKKGSETNKNAAGADNKGSGSNKNTAGATIYDNVEIKRDPKVGNTIYECESKSDNSTNSNIIDNIPITCNKQENRCIGTSGSNNSESSKDDPDRPESKVTHTPKHTNSKVDFDNECVVSYSKAKAEERATKKASNPDRKPLVSTFTEKAFRSSKWDSVMDSRLWLRRKSARKQERDRASSLSLDGFDFCDEELHQIDLNPGDEFKLALECLENGYLVTLNEELFCAYPHRTDYKKVLYIVIDGDMDLDEVEVGGGEGPDRTLVMELYQACNWSGDVVVLTDDNFESLVLNSEDRWMVDAYAAWCPACAHLRPEWEDAARILHGMVKLGASDCDRNDQLTDDLNILYYPTILYFPEGRKTFRSALVYEGRHRSDCIVPWALQKISGRSGMPIGIIPSKAPPRTLRKKRQSSLKRRGYRPGGMGYQNVPTTKMKDEKESPWHSGICGESAHRQVTMLEPPAMDPNAPPQPTQTAQKEGFARCMLL